MQDFLQEFQDILHWEVLLKYLYQYKDVYKAAVMLRTFLLNFYRTRVSIVSQWLLRKKMIYF